jgi:iron complex outermembrane receptor protein
VAASRRLSGLVATAGLVFVLLPPLAMAQADPASSAGTSVLEEVVVTAQRREQSLLEVPLAVTALGGEELEQLGALDLIYLSQVTPNATIEIARGTNNALAAYIRGVGQQDHIAGFESGVGLYVDDVYFARPQLAVLQVYDVERIEVLRGPQGTLYGRNTVGGAIRYVTRRLDPQRMLKLQGRVGSHGLLDTIATGSTPLGNSLRLGGSVASFRQDGYGDNLIVPGLRNYNRDILAARGSLEWQRGDRWFLRLAADWQQDDSDLQRGHRMMPGGFSGAPVLDDRYDTRAGNLVPVADAEARGLSLLVEWTVHDRLSWRGIFASRADETWKPTDLDSLPTVDVDVSTWDRNEQDTAELQAVFDADRWSGVAGLFLLNASAETRLEALLGTTGALIGRPGLNNQLVTRADTRNWAVFADIGFAFGERWSGSLGGRYTHDERSSVIHRRILVGGRSSFFGGNGVVARTLSDFAGSEDFEKFTPRAVLQWQPADTHNIYLSYSQGFKGGGFDPRGLTSSTPDFDGDGEVSDAEVFRFMKFYPEEVASWEAGWKSLLFGSRMTSRLAIFTADYRDVQIPGSVGVDRDGDGVIEDYIGATTNAAAANISGLEWEGNVIVATDLGQPGARLDLSWALGWIDAGFSQFIDDNGEDVAREVTFANTPRWTASATARYGLPVDWFDVAGELAVINTLSARGDDTQFYTRDPLMDQDAYALWDLGVVWSGAGGLWQLGAHGRNLTDQAYKVSGLDIILGLEGNTTVYYGNPRQFWLDLQYHFR